MKTNSAQLHKAIRNLLIPSVTNVYYENIPKPATYPYAVFSTRLMGTTSGQQSYQLEIDVAAKDQKTVEDLADSIEDNFDYLSFANQYLFFHVYRATRYTVVEEDKSIERRHLTFDLYYYTREN